MTASPPSIKGPTCALATPLGSWCQQQHEAEPPLEPSRQACFHGGRSREGMGVGGWLVHLFSSHPQGMWWRRAPAGLVPSFLFISFYLLLSLQSWLPSRQLARPLSTQPLPLLRCGVSPGPRWGLPVLLSLWSPACLPCAPAPHLHPTAGTALGWGLQYLPRHQQQSWRWFSGLTTGTPNCTSPSAPPCTLPLADLSGLGLILCVPRGSYEDPLKRGFPP